MATLDDDLDRLYQGPLDAFTEARNALSKSARQPGLKKLEKPSVPAWAVNQLHWHHREVLDRVDAAAAALLEQHQRTLAGKTGEIHKAEQVHRDAVRQALAVAKDVLRGDGHPETPATLDAIRNTLQALPSPEAQGRLTRPLAPRGLEALAGLVMAAPARPAPGADKLSPPADDDRGAATRHREAERFGARARAEQERARERERARLQAEAERAEREREARRAAAAAALAEAEATLKEAEAALSEAERALELRREERDAARKTLAQARKTAAAE